MFQQFNYFRLFYPQIRKISTSLQANQKNHYDSLGISSKATQADVKSAYYKLSMVYHPDKNNDSTEAAQKFRDITEAYEVLGNVKSRKLYDRGLFLGNRSSTFDEPPENRFYKSRETRTRPPAPMGRTVYDFDEWSKEHYGATFQRDMRNREKARKIRIAQDQFKSDIKNEQIIFLVGLFVLCGFYALHDKNLDLAGANVKIIGSEIVTRKDK